MKKIAVILCGSGFKDGSEIRESVAVLWALSKFPTAHISVQCFAPDLNQTDVVNCLTFQAVPGESRNMLIESARIARGKVLPLTDLNPAEYAAVIIPGGFGAAKNLCDFASKGAQATVLAKLEEILQQMHAARKPIGAVCIAPAIVALALKDHKLELTVGEAGETAQEIEKLGHQHVVCRVDDAYVDTVHRVVTTPAYMFDDAPLHSIFTGIEKLVNEVIGMTA